MSKTMDPLVACAHALAYVDHTLEFWDWSRFPNSEIMAKRLRDELQSVLDAAAPEQPDLDHLPEANHG